MKRYLKESRKTSHKVRNSFGTYVIHRGLVGVRIATMKNNSTKTDNLQGLGKSHKLAFH